MRPPSAARSSNPWIDIAPRVLPARPSPPAECPAQCCGIARTTTTRGALGEPDCNAGLRPPHLRSRRVMQPDEALEALVTDSGDRLLRLAFQLTHDHSAAEDVVQEALMAIYRSWRRRLPDVEHLEAYARRAVVNEFLRRRRLRSSTEVVTPLVPDVAGGSFEPAVVSREVLWGALGTLPARQRAVLVLRYYEDLPDAAIATMIGAREATVRSLALRGLSALRSAEPSLDLR